MTHSVPGRRDPAPPPRQTAATPTRRTPVKARRRAATEPRNAATEPRNAATEPRNAATEPRSTDAEPRQAPGQTSQRPRQTPTTSPRQTSETPRKAPGMSLRQTRQAPRRTPARSAGQTPEPPPQAATAPNRAAAGPGAGFQPVKSADRTLDVLEALAADPDKPTLGELARRLGIPKSSLHAVLRTLQARGWVQADETGTRFALGIRALRVGAAFVEADDAVSVLAPVLDDLAAQFGETVHLGRLDGTDVVYLAKRESVHPLRLFSAIGRRLPAHATALGKALLAQQPDEQLARLLPTPLPRLTPHTLTDLAALRADLAATRADGYAVDREENSEGIICVAVAVPARRPGEASTDAISVSVPTSRHSPALQERIAAALLAAVG